MAEAQGIEWEPLEEALNQSKYLDTVLQEYQEGRDLGFDGIPAFVIGNIKFTGAQSMEDFRKVAEHAQQMLEADPQSFIGKRRVL